LLCFCSAEALSVSFPRHPQEWSIFHVKTWLQNEGFPNKIVAAFEDNCVSGKLLNDLLDSPDLLEAELGIVGHIQKKSVLEALKKLLGV
jgi:hypothetical protein